MPMQITPPFGYQELAPLNRERKVRLLKAGEIPEFARTQNAIPISYTEFGPVSRDYPIVFTSADQGANFAPMAVLGLTAGENLYYGNGAWSAGLYVPAYARRVPF
ncbi:MAG: SapC family protein, partial [Betaproteobacteria bacterium]|nr:SapC family protein [Betaproteobacteria bacterium]